MSSRSMTDVAYEIVVALKKEVAFDVLWGEVCKENGYNQSQSMNKIASFYSAMMLDSRFTNIKDNIWDLKARHKFDETRINTSDLIIEDDSTIDESEEVEYSDSSIDIENMRSKRTNSEDQY